MKAKHVGLILLILAMVGFIGFSATSYADWGRGGGGCPMGGGGYGPRGFAGPGYGGDLTDEETAALQKERNAFLEQTRELRENLYQKHLELRAELAKQKPDPKKAAGLQKEVSGLRGALDQKRLDQQLCSSASEEASYVLRALGRSDELAHCSLRFSVGRFTTDADIDVAIAAVEREVSRLRAMAPRAPQT